MNMDKEKTLVDTLQNGVKVFSIINAAGSHLFAAYTKDGTEYTSQCTEDDTVGLENFKKFLLKDPAFN